MVTPLTLWVGVACLVGVVRSAPAHSADDVIDMLMPGVTPKQPDTYLCRSMKVKDAHRYITGYAPQADASIAHHMLLFGCEEPGREEGVWNCGEMASMDGDEASSQPPQYPRGPVCARGQSILYAWALEAPALTLPPDVGFDVGGATGVKYLVMQVHYKDVTKFLPPENGKDSSGIILHTTTTPTSKQAGVYFIGTDGNIPAHSIEYMEAACPVTDDQQMVPFAYRTHAHTLGRVVSGYRIRGGEWTEIGRKDPRLPEMFYNVTNPGITIEKGDILAARCTMENTHDKDVAIGNTQEDEMCNFYIMYYTTGKLPEQTSCWSLGPPNWSWKDFRDTTGLNLDAKPTDISVIPGSDKPLLANATHEQAASDLSEKELLYNYLQSIAEEEEEEEEEEERRRYINSQGYYGQDTQDQEFEPLDFIVPGL